MAARRDIAIGIATSILSMAIGLAVVPFYLRFLGVEAYGLVSFVAVLQGVVQILDLGMTPTISREVARARELGDLKRLRSLLHSLACIYLATGALIGAVVYSLSEPIAVNWLDIENIPFATAVQALGLMGAIVGLRWPITIYSGALIGAQKLTLVATLNLLMIATSSLGVIFVLAFVDRSIFTFFLCQTMVAALHLLIIRHLAWRTLGVEGKRFAISALKNVWRFSAAMSGVTLTAVGLTQLDKITTSGLLSLEAFAFYSLGGVVGRALYGLINPLYHVIYPRFCAMVANEKSDQLARSYRLWTTAFASVFFPASIAVAVAASPLILLWSGDENVARNVGPLAALIAIGSAIHGVMYFPYSLQLAYGDSRLPLLTNIALILVYAPLLAILIIKFGAFGAALSWPLLTSFYLILGTWVTHRRYLPDIVWIWLLRDVGVPLLISSFFGAVGVALIGGTSMSLIGQLAVVAFLTVAAVSANIVIALLRYEEIRSEFTRALKLCTVG